MSESKEKSALTEVEQLAARWNRDAHRAQGSSFEDIAVSALAKNHGAISWARLGKTATSDTIARCIHLSFEELIGIEKPDRKSATHLLEICEATFLYEQECNVLEAFNGIDGQAYQQHMRFVEKFGLYQDYPVVLPNPQDEVSLEEEVAA